jgi:hypothetical protein
MGDLRRTPREHHAGHHRVPSRVARWGAAGAVIAVTACSPSAPGDVNTPPTVPPSAPTGGLAVSTVSGVAYEHTAGGIQPLGNLPLRVDGMRDGYAHVTIDVVTDADGRYEVPGLEREFVMVGARPQHAYLSPCSSRLWLRNDDAVNVHVVSRAVLLATGTPQSMPPLSKLAGYPLVGAVSGFVTESTPGGVRPVAEASVEHLYGDGRSGNPTGFTLTNADGYYVLCGYWDDYGQAVRVSKDGYRTAIQSIGASWLNDFQVVRN